MMESKPNYCTPTRTQYQRSIQTRNLFVQWVMAYSQQLGGILLVTVDPANPNSNTLLCDGGIGDEYQVRLVNQHATPQTGNLAWELELELANGRRKEGWLAETGAKWLVVGHGNPLDFMDYRVIEPSKLLNVIETHRSKFPERRTKWATQQRNLQASNPAVGAVNALMPLGVWLQHSHPLDHWLFPEF